jgi:hypothetical protein
MKHIISISYILDAEKALEGICIVCPFPVGIVINEFCC